MKIKDRAAKQVQNRNWQMSFADMLTILLVFFILVLSLSSIDTKKIREMQAAMQPQLLAGQMALSTSRQGLADAMNQIEGLHARVDRLGVRVSVSDRLLYVPGSARIENAEILARIAPLLRGTRGSIRVEGHTDSTPIATAEFPSNWELSTARAVNAVKYLVEREGIPPERIAAAGYADTRPVAAASDAEGRAKNRRIEIILESPS